MELTITNTATGEITTSKLMTADEALAAMNAMMDAADAVEPVKVSPLRRFAHGFRPSDSLHTVACHRCQGSGRHSYCEMYGDTCFQCGGKGKVLAKDDARAWAEFTRCFSAETGTKARRIEKAMLRCSLKTQTLLLSRHQASKN